MTSKTLIKQFEYFYKWNAKLRKLSFCGWATLYDNVLPKTEISHHLSIVYELTKQVNELNYE